MRAYFVALVLALPSMAAARQPEFDSSYPFPSGDRYGASSFSINPGAALPFSLDTDGGKILHSLNVLGKPAALWLISFDPETLQVLRSATSRPMRSTLATNYPGFSAPVWWEYDFSAAKIDQTWGDNLALLIPAGSTWDAWVTRGPPWTVSYPQPNIPAVASRFSGGHEFSERGFNPVGSRLEGIRGFDLNPPDPMNENNTWITDPSIPINFDWVFEPAIRATYTTPEPSGLVMLGIGLTVMGTAHLRRRRLRR